MSTALGTAIQAPIPGAENRRSSRLALAIPVELMTADETGQPLREATRTLFLNKHGAKILTRHRHRTGSEVDVRIPHLERMKRCMVVRCEPNPERGGYETAIELTEAENFWGVQFPPEDWSKPEQRGFLPPGPAGDMQTEMLHATLNSLISLMENKGLIARDELIAGVHLFRRRGSASA